MFASRRSVFLSRRTIRNTFASLENRMGQSLQVHLPRSLAPLPIPGSSQVQRGGSGGPGHPTGAAFEVSRVLGFEGAGDEGVGMPGQGGCLRWRAGDRLAEPVVGACGTASWHQGFRHQSIAKIAPETRFWATPAAPLPSPSSPPSHPASRLHPLPPRRAPTGRATADHVNTLMELIHHPPGGRLRSQQPGRLAPPTPPGGRL